MRLRRTFAVVVATALMGAAAGCGGATKEEGGGGGSTGSGSDAAKEPVKVGFVYSKTGLLSVYSPAYLAGFKAGLDYATKGTNTAGGHKIEISYVDDKGNPSTAVNAAKTQISGGAKVILGTMDSGIALQLAPLAAQNKVLYINGAAAVDKITGANEFTFRSGRQTFQDVATAGSFLESPKGKKVIVLAQNTAFGQGNFAAVKAVLGGKGANVSDILVPASATDVTPFALQVKNAKPDMVFVAWAGNTTTAMWKALDQQGVFDSTTVVTGLGNTASYPAYGATGSKISFLGYYFPGVSGTPVEKEMINRMDKAGVKPDIFSPDGFVAAQMLVRAIEEGGNDPQKMVAALDGWTFDAPKGSQTIRKGDHAVLQPMFQVKLTGSGASLKPELTKTVPAADTAPPQ